MVTPAPFPAAAHDRTADAAVVPYTKTSGDEPLPGYRLIAPLGRGGFGEVWKAEAPGGLHKAVKFVAPDPTLDGPAGGHALRQEFEAFQHIKAIRHPFILQLERVELISGELVMVMELADSQLQDRFHACTARGLAGIPREELLGYFADAAEALDVIGAKYGLQHLDIKPANLFVIAGHAKIGDYGLVARMDAGGTPTAQTSNRGLTPRYVAPEVLRGRIDPRSDQYSLALVYQELLTGTYPYPGRTAAQIMFQHVTAAPDLSGLPELDRGAVARALQKDPGDRFPSCMAFVQALMSAGLPPVGSDTRSATDTAANLMLRSRVDRSVAELNLSAEEPAAPAPGTNRVRETLRTPLPPLPGSTTDKPTGAVTLPGRSLPPLTTPGPRRSAPQPPPAPRPAAAYDEIILTPVPIESAAPAIRLKPIHAVVPVARLLGGPDNNLRARPETFAEVVVAAAAGGTAPRTPGEVTLLPNGTWTCRFPSTLLPSVAPLKLTTLVEDQWCDEVTQPEPTRILLRVHSDVGMGFWNKLARKAGAEVEIRLPGGPRHAASPRLAGGSGTVRQSAFAVAGGKDSLAGREVVGGAGEIEVSGYVYGSPDQAFACRAMEGIPELMREVRKLLQNVDDRRKDPRLPLSSAVVAYPISEDGTVHPAIPGICRDVSAGGVCFVTRASLPTRYIFLAFPELPETEDLAVLTKVLRSSAVGYEHVYAGRFRTDL